MGAAASVEIGLDGNRIIKSAPVIEGTSNSIQAIMQEKGTVTLAEIGKELLKFETAESIICKHFANAVVGQHVLDRAVKVLANHDITPANTLFAQSVCPDEINHNTGDITTLFSSWMGEVFHMGGLAGLPFTGKTGFAAFSHHVPDGGNLCILFAPHIGISDAGCLGQYSRLGQECDGAACGAAVGALKYCTDCNEIPNFESLGAHPEDYQMKYIITGTSAKITYLAFIERLLTEINKRKDKINMCSTANEKNAALVYEVFDMAREFLENVVHLDFGIGHGKKGKLILLGGLQINMPTHMMDYFEPLVFEIRSKGEPTIDLMKEAFNF